MEYSSEKPKKKVIQGEPQKQTMIGEESAEKQIFTPIEKVPGRDLTDSMFFVRVKEDTTPRQQTKPKRPVEITQNKTPDEPAVVGAERVMRFVRGRVLPVCLAVYFIVFFTILVVGSVNQRSDDL